MFTKIRFLYLMSLTLISLGLTACETMEGAGRDIERAGQSIENAAD